MPTMMVATKLLAIVSDSGEPIVSLTTVRKLLTPMTNGHRRRKPAPAGARRAIRSGSAASSAASATSTALASRLTQKTMPMTPNSESRIDPDVAAQHVEIVEEEERRDQEDAERGGRQQRRPEGDRQPAEIGRILRRRVGVESAGRTARRPPNSSTAAATSAKKAAAKDGLELELDDEFQPRRDGAVEARDIRHGHRRAARCRRRPSARSAWSARCGTDRCASGRSSRSAPLTRMDSDSARPSTALISAFSAVKRLALGR